MSKQDNTIPSYTALVLLVLTRSRPDHLRQRVVDISRPRSAHGRRQQIAGAVRVGAHPAVARVGRHHRRLEEVLLRLPLLLLQRRHEEGVGLAAIVASPGVGPTVEEGPARHGGPVGVAGLEVGRRTEPRGTGRAAVVSTSTATAVGHGHGHGRLRGGIDRSGVEDHLVHHLGRPLPAPARASRPTPATARPHPAAALHAIGLRHPLQEPSLQLAQFPPGLLDLLRSQSIDIGRPPPKHLLANTVVADKLFGDAHRIAVEELGQEGAEGRTVR